MTDYRSVFDEFREFTLSNVPDGAEALALARITGSGEGLRAVFVARDGQRLAQAERALGFAAPGLATLEFPAWDCLPYDRVSPTPAVVARRMTTLSRLVRPTEGPGFVLLTTANALVQRVVPHAVVGAQIWGAAQGNRVDMAALTGWLEDNGFSRVSTVRDTGEYAVRGGIVDLFAPGTDLPVRLDFFGDTLDSIRSFDPETQRSVGQLRRLDLVPMSEVVLTPATIKRFRQNYLSLFGGATRDDPLYESISEGRRYAGVEHWLPLFHDGLETLFHYCGDAPLVLDPLADESIDERLKTVRDHFEARAEALKIGNTGGAPYKPVEPTSLYLAPGEIAAALASRDVVRLTPFSVPDAGRKIVDFGGKQGRSFAAERAGGDVNVFDALVTHFREVRERGKRVLLACWTEGSRDRLAQVLADHGVQKAERVETLEAALALPTHILGLVVLGLETGFETDRIVIVGEQDVLGDAWCAVRGARRPRTR
ncbi:Transcription-repair-coupling factor [Methylobrevis pamukkalensis]|uniref:Transcription-repair-coupling factor n=1 Tax=Methylobrevis pamukkalensis TaxID=1439726 RepID=A0A1E3H3E0_9HYPH|nr:Transcription-repair-coupling factor [Methylobrevis pamukkalensis]